VALLKRKPAQHDQDPLGLNRRALSAATALVQLDGTSSWKNWKFGNKDWQVEAWRLYDVVPEGRFLANWIGDSLSQARLYVAELDERGEEINETEDQRISALAGIPLGTGSQRDDALRLAGVDLAVGGECWVIGEGAASNPESSKGAWFVVTGSAFSKRGGRIEVRRPKTLGGSTLALTDGTDVLIRCWRPHPNDTDQADSPTRAAIVPLREVELLTKREFAELDSRLTGAGVWFLPEGVDFPRDPADSAGIAGFMQYMQRAAAASMRDQSTAAAMVPIMATLPTDMIEHIDKLKPINFWSELSAEISPMKEKAIIRVAGAYEVPNEVMLGMSTANHWTAWIISEEGIKRIKPYGALVADALTRGFLRMALTSMGIPNPERYAFAFDYAALAARPNRIEDAGTLHDRGLISDEEYVKAAAFDPSVMPDQDKRVAQLLYKLVQVQPDLILDPEVQRVLGLPKIQSVGLPATANQNADGQDPEPDDETEERDAPNGGDADGPPDETRALTEALGARVQALATRPVPALPSPEAVFNAAAKLLVYRALELAGGRLATPAERHGRWKDVPRHELHHWVGPITAEKAHKVTEGAWNHVTVAAADLGVDPADFRALLEGYVLELLTRGVRHHDDLLFAALSMARQGRGLVAA
jgi:hypothetical protein